MPFWTPGKTVWTDSTTALVPFSVCLAFCCPQSQALTRTAWTHGRAVKPVCSASALLGRFPGAWHGMPFSVIIHVSLTFATLPLFRLPHLHQHHNRLMHCAALHGTLYRAMYSCERPAHSAVQESYCSHCCCVQAYKSRFVSSNASSKGNLMVLTQIQSVPMHYQHATLSMYTCVFSKAPYTPSTALHSADYYAY